MQQSISMFPKREIGEKEDLYKSTSTIQIYGTSNNSYIFAHHREMKNYGKGILFVKNFILDKKITRKTAEFEKYINRNHT